MSSILRCISCTISCITYPTRKLIDIYERNIFTEKYTIKFQLLLSFIITTVILIGFTIALLFGLLYGTGSFTITKAYSTIISHTKSNAYNVGLEIAGAIEQEIKIIAETISLSNALYAKNLILNRDVLYQANSADGVNGKVKQFPEYCFTTPTYTTTGICGAAPTDYGQFQTGTTRLPNLPDFRYGSLIHTSIYVADTAVSGTNPGRRNQADYSNTVANDFLKVVDALGYQDQDLKLLYEKGPSSTVFFYLSAKFGSSATTYKAAHRTYPGLVKNDDTYDPPQRTWFKKAPENAFYVSSYKETFSEQLVITISSRKLISSSSSGLSDDTTVVASATMLLTDIAKMLTDISYENEGFGVLLSYDKLKVLSWLNKDTYNVNANDFMDLSSLDDNLAKLDVKSGGKFEYKDPNGVNWIVASIPFLQITDYSTTSTSYAFIILIFSKSSLALSSMSDLRHNVSHTLAESTKKTLIILAIVTFAIMNLIGFTIFYIVTPIDKMRYISQELIRIAGDDEENRDYSAVINHQFFSKFRTDEIGHTAFEYYRVICVLNNRIVQKRKIPKCPKNPFYIEEAIDFSNFGWNEFYSRMKPKRLRNSTVAESTVVASEVVDMTDSLDVLGQITAAKNKKQNKNKKNFIKVNMEEETAIDEGDIELGAITFSEDIAQVPQDKFKTTRFSSVGLKLKMLCVLLLSALLIVAILTIVDLWVEGGEIWMKETSLAMESKQMDNLASIAFAKARFVKYFVQKVYVTMESARQYSNYLFAGIISSSAARTSSSAFNSYFFGHKYALDSDASTSDSYSLTTSNDFSGYWISPVAPTWTANSDIPSKQSSLLDLKFVSYLYSNSFASFVQLGLQTEGYFRNLPYTKTNYKYPSKCTIEDTTDADCATAYTNSKCSNSGLSSYNYYDPRCRSWYQVGKSYQNTADTYFSYPRISSSGSFVITAFAPVYNSISTLTSSSFVGVININVLVTALTDSVNALKILSDGYAYIIDTTAPNNLIMHPKATGDCLEVNCAEGFSNSEYDSFYNNVLIPIKTGSTPASTYTKKGKIWRISTISFNFATVKYTLVATVSRDAILVASNAVQAAIKSSVITLIVLFGIGMFILGFAALELTIKMTRAIVDPIQDLRYICTKLANNDYSCTIPTNPSSSDMRQLLDAFSHLLVALKFGSDTYARGDVNLAKDVFSDALTLFETTENGKGMSACHNNLGVVETALKNYAAAEIHYIESINFVRKFLMQGNHISDDFERAQRTLSDRKGNLALLYLEKEEFKKAFDLLEELLESDKKNGYIRGCVIKQGNLGQYYLKQGELKSAERIFSSALKFVRTKDASLFDGDTWNEQEASASEQIALFNLAKLYIPQKKDGKKVKKKNNEKDDLSAQQRLEGMHRVEAKLSGKHDSKNADDDVNSNSDETPANTNDDDANQLAEDKNKSKMSLENRYLEALTKTHYMHMATTKNILDSLLNIYNEQKDVHKAEEITKFAAHHKFDLKATQSSMPKRIVFVIDYSGSMSGTKIKAAVQSMLMIFDDHMGSEDELMLVKFTSSVSVEFPLLKKGKDDVHHLRQKIAAMTNPGGATAFRDGVSYALKELSKRSTSNDWVVSLTDGDDNSSSISDINLKNEIRNSSAGLVVIGVGSDVDEKALKPLTEVHKTGFYIKAGSNFDSISSAFGKVANIIQGQMVLEDV